MGWRNHEKDRAITFRCPLFITSILVAWSSGMLFYGLATSRLVLGEVDCTAALVMGQVWNTEMMNKRKSKIHAHLSLDHVFYKDSTYLGIFIGPSPPRWIIRVPWWFAWIWIKMGLR